MKRGVIEQYHPSFCVSSFIYFISLAKQMRVGKWSL